MASFEIIEHAHDRIVEVVYPAHASAVVHAQYTVKIKQVIDAQVGPWGLLVDQHRQHLDDRLKGKMLLLHHYAMKHGLLRSARVVRTSAEALRVSNMVRDTALAAIFRVFQDPDVALAWLRNELRERPA